MASISARGSSAKPGHLRAQAGFINEYEARWIEIELAVEPRRPCLAGVNRPARALAIQAMAVVIPIPNRAAAERADMPSRDAARTRLRRSSLRARVILPPTKSPVGAMESEFGDQGNPQRDSAFNGRALDNEAGRS
jgi:hypothetical protein